MRIDRFYTDEASSDHLEHIRRGTSKTYESEWTLINNAESHGFTHQLGDIPRFVDVSTSEVAGGDAPVDGTSTSSFAKTSTTITVTSSAGSGSNLYFRVRAS